MRSAVYSRKRMGPRINPCGTPHIISARDEADENKLHADRIFCEGINGIRSATSEITF